MLRVTKQHFDDMTRDEFHETVPIARPLLSAWVSGAALVQGRVKVEMEFNEGQAAFVLKLDGDSRSTTVSSARSIRIHGGGTSTFHVEKRILFDGISFNGQPTTVSLTNDSHICRICSTRRGMVGRLAVRVARRRVRKMRPQALRIVERDSRTLIRDQFDQLAGELIQELNKTTPFEQTIMQLFPETKTWVYNLSTTDKYIQASAGPKGLRFPELPKRDEGDRLEPVELWIRTGNAEPIPEVLAVWNIAQDLLRSFVPQEADLPEPHRGQATVEQVGDWVVIAVGT